MEKKGTSVIANVMIWFGAGISIAEIITGTYLAPLGFKNGIMAIIIGHIIGGVIMYLAGIIGAKTQKSSMESVKISYGSKGGILFSFLNVVQLVGWTAIMIYDGALAANELLHKGVWLWALIIGALIILWIKIGIKNLEKINFVAMTGLGILSILLCRIIFVNTGVGFEPSEAMSFGLAVELGAAMPLSWLPVISDYTRDAEKPLTATLASVLVYNLVSIWMFIMGMGAAILTGESDIANIFLKAGLGMAGLLIVVFSTVTTTFLDAFSAGVSSKSISSHVDEKKIGMVTAVVGTILAMTFPMDNITDFLLFIGSVFAPMIAIVFVDFYIVKKDYSNDKYNWLNLVIWAVGFIIYRYLLTIETAVGNTLPDIVITMIIAYIVKKIALAKK